MNPAPELKPWWSETWRTWSEHVGGCRHELARQGDPRANVARQRGRRLLLRTSPKRQQRQPPQSGRRGLQTRGEVQEGHRWHRVRPEASVWRSPHGGTNSTFEVWSWTNQPLLCLITLMPVCWDLRGFIHEKRSSQVCTKGISGYDIGT
jgi:hypothetical protein